jgi:RNA polymerase sigma-70 factor (ECF subfamily)
MEKTVFSEAVRQYQKQLLVIAFHYCGNRQDAEDLVQDVFLKLYTHPLPPKGAHLRNWLIRATINRCKNHLHSGHHRLRAPMEAAEQVLEEPDLTRQAIWDAITALPQIYREVVVLYYYSGYTTAEIGRLLHRKPATVQSQLMRARSMLKDQLKEVWEE